MDSITLYFDFLSPYSYFAWKNLKRKNSFREKYQFEFRPVLMGKLFSTHEIKGPGEIPAKRYLMLKSCFRYASRESIPFVPPKAHPFNPLYVLRLATQSCSGKHQEEVIDALWEYVWAKGLPADDPDQLKSFLNSKGLPGEELMEKSFLREAKLELKTNTKEAISKNIFGVPTFNSKGENFWGNDSLIDLERFLNGEESYDEQLFKNRTEDIDLNLN